MPALCSDVLEMPSAILQQTRLGRPVLPRQSGRNFQDFQAAVRWWACQSCHSACQPCCGGHCPAPGHLNTAALQRYNFYRLSTTEILRERERDILRGRRGVASGVEVTVAVSPVFSLPFLSRRPLIMRCLGVGISPVSQEIIKIFKLVGTYFLSECR